MSTQISIARKSFKQRVVAPLALVAALGLGISGATTVAHHGHTGTAAGTAVTASSISGTSLAASLAESVSETSVVAGRSRAA